MKKPTPSFPLQQHYPVSVTCTCRNRSGGYLLTSRTCRMDFASATGEFLKLVGGKKSRLKKTSKDTMGFELIVLRPPPWQSGNAFRPVNGRKWVWIPQWELARKAGVLWFSSRCSLWFITEHPHTPIHTIFHAKSQPLAKLHVNTFSFTCELSWSQIELQVQRFPGLELLIPYGRIQRI